MHGLKKPYCIRHQEQIIKRSKRMDKRYETDPNNIIFEAIEAELVVINLKSGCYYSLNESASGIWKLIISGYAINQISEFFSRHYSSTAIDMAEEISRIVREFLHEELISPVLGNETSVENALLEGVVLAETFQRPAMTKHADIQEMLALDPVHEVTDLGWPHKKGESA